MDRNDCVNSTGNHNPVTDGLIGLAVGDAFGVPVEFLSRDEVESINPHDMLGKDCGVHLTSRWSDLIPRGAWSDDTSMTIAAMASIITHGGSIDYDDIMKQFLAWWEDGQYTSLKYPFGLGTNISYALERYKQGTPALECGGAGIRDNGNGALMRMFPFSMYCILKGCTDEETLGVIRNAAGITHRHEINLMSCYMYTLFLRECMRTGDPSTAYERAVFNKKKFYSDLLPHEAVDAHALLLNIDFRSTFNYRWIPENGYVVTSLAVLIYSILSTDNYEDAVKTSVSFGYDTDTNAAITGSVAGVMYGTDNIPERWICHLIKRDYLKKIAEDFYRVI